MGSYEVCPDAIECHSADPCEALWLSAIELYLCDAWAYLADRHAVGDKGEALADLTGSQSLLRTLCAPLGLDTAEIASAMVARLNTGERVKLTGAWR